MPDWTFHSLAEASSATLERVLTHGTEPDLGSLPGWELRGWTVSSTMSRPVFWASTWGRFLAWCYPTRAGLEDGVLGRVLQASRGGRRAPWTCVPNEAEPKTLAWFKVRPPEPHENANTLVLDFDEIENPRWLRGSVRGVLTCPNRDAGDVLLSKTTFSRGLLQTSVFSVMERLQRARALDD